MDISDNLLAAYVEGQITDAERNAVRRYLAEHPDELKCVALMMDTNDDLDTEEFDVDTAPLQHKASFSDICYSAAAFVPNIVPRTNVLGNHIKTFGSKSKTTFSQRLESLLDDISK